MASNFCSVISTVPASANSGPRSDRNQAPPTPALAHHNSSEAEANEASGNMGPASYPGPLRPMGSMAPSNTYNGPPRPKGSMTYTYTGPSRSRGSMAPTYTGPSRPKGSMAPDCDETEPASPQGSMGAPQYPHEP